MNLYIFNILTLLYMYVVINDMNMIRLLSPQGPQDKVSKANCTDKDLYKLLVIEFLRLFA
jgi:hypothetical protein